MVWTEFFFVRVEEIVYVFVWVANDVEHWLLKTIFRLVNYDLLRVLFWSQKAYSFWSLRNELPIEMVDVPTII